MMKVLLTLSNCNHLILCYGIFMLSLVIDTTSASVYLNASCKEIKCGSNSVCVTRGATSCECLCPFQMLHKHEHGCIVPECRENYDCRRDQRCSNGRCVSLCSGVCGANARCEVIPDGRVTCTCYSGYAGDPTIYCRPLSPSELCSSTCGINQECRIVKGVPVCNCKSGFIRDVRGNCIHECEVDTHCQISQYCDNYKCVHVCNKCGINSQCNSYDGAHGAICECPKNHRGNPYKKCEPECYTNEECPFQRPFCQRGGCYDPCPSSCGIGASCHVHENRVACVCPQGTEGNPLFRCDPKRDSNPCKPNPCGINALCEIGTIDGELCAVCTCPKSLKGDPNKECVPGECSNDNECFSNQYCRNYRCIDACTPTTCGRDANCTIHLQKPVCSCAEGLSGDPSRICFSIRVQPLSLY